MFCFYVSISTDVNPHALPPSQLPLLYPHFYPKNICSLPRIEVLKYVCPLLAKPYTNISRE